MTPATVLRRAAARVRNGAQVRDAVFIESLADSTMFMDACGLLMGNPAWRVDPPKAMEAAADAWEAGNPGKVEAP